MILIKDNLTVRTSPFLHDRDTDTYLYYVYFEELYDNETKFRGLAIEMPALDIVKNGGFAETDFFLDYCERFEEQLIELAQEETNYYFETHPVPSK